MTQQITRRTIDGIPCRCLDIGCDDLERAARNRLIIKEKLFTTFYLLMEASLSRTPLGQRPAKWIPLGELPQVNRKDWQQYGGEKEGLYEMEEKLVVRDLTSREDGVI